jgi:flagellar basal-body rod modification protein FlgD
MAVAPVAATTTQSQTTSTSSAEKAATDAFGLSFDSLLKIILTQLTYQDPLKPMDNFEFVSQLAQFSQIQQGQTANDKLESIAAAQANLQAASLLGRQVDIPAGNGTLSGKVTAISFNDGVPQLTIQTADNQTISNISIANVSQIREAQ